jgi:hypothetical protein
MLSSLLCHSTIYVDLHSLSQPEHGDSRFSPLRALVTPRRRIVHAACIFITRPHLACLFVTMTTTTTTTTPHKAEYFSRPSPSWNVFDFVDYMLSEHPDHSDRRLLNLWLTKLRRIEKCRDRRNCCSGPDRYRAKVLGTSYRRMVSSRFFYLLTHPSNNGGGHHRARGHTICSSQDDLESLIGSAA